MPKVQVFKTDGTKSGQMTLSDDVFGAKINEAVLHQVVVAHLANKRQGTQSTRTRSEVRGGGAKPWRQKGTGRARHGTTRSPIWAGGGVVFAPKPRDYSKSVNKKVKKVAMKSALSMKVKENNIIVLDELVLKEAKTKEMVQVLSNLKVEKKALVVLPDKDDSVVRASSNIPGVSSTFSGELSVYDILNHDMFIITKDAVKKVEEGLSK